MFAYRTIQDRVNKDCQNTERLCCVTEKNIADITYIAMMADIELEEETEEANHYDDAQ